MTRALDTNVLVRVLADRRSLQLAAAEALVEAPFTISLSVFMETEWVLRSVFGWKRAQIVEAFRNLADLPAITPPAGIGWAIERFAAGADFGDMVHLLTSGAVTGFATFDRSIARAAGADAPVPIETLD